MSIAGKAATPHSEGNNVQHSSTSADTADTNRGGFAQLSVPAPIVATLNRLGITEPFPIQQLTLPDSLAGRDVLGRGATGSGKTLSFSIPTVARVAAQQGRSAPNRPRALILVPTRELAAQVAEVVEPIATAMSLRCTTVFGGVSQVPQVAALRKGVDILIACPGRLEDLIAQRLCSLADVRVTVLDEADHMADLGFLPAVRRLLDATPAGGQRLLFSATLDNGVDTLVKRYIVDPVVHSLATASVPAKLEHHILSIEQADKVPVLREIAHHTGRLLLFTRTKRGANRLTRQLVDAGVPAHELHGDLSQGARTRNLAAFASARRSVLVATDIAARGIHVDDVDLVVHVDPPADHKAYLHRSGRTARAGAAGVVAMLMTPEQRKDVAQLTRAAGITPRTTQVGVGHPLLASIGRPDGDTSELPPMKAPAPRPKVARPQKSHAAPGARNGKAGRRPAQRGASHKAAVGGSR